MNYAKLYPHLSKTMDNCIVPIKMLRIEPCIGCLPKEICKTCRKNTKGYVDGMCEKCANAYTEAFYKISEDMLGVKFK